MQSPAISSHSPAGEGAENDRIALGYAVTRGKCPAMTRFQNALPGDSKYEIALSVHGHIKGARMAKGTRVADRGRKSGNGRDGGAFASDGALTLLDANGLIMGT